MIKYKRISWISLFCLSLLSFVRYIDNTNYFLIDILSQFPFQYAIMSLVLIFFCIWKKRYLIASLAGLLFVFNVGSVVDFDRYIHAFDRAGKTFKIYSANVHIYNHELSKLNQELREVDPEMVLLLEVTPEHLGQIQPLIHKYPYHIVKSFIGKREIGFVFLSKYEILDSHVIRLSDICNFVLEAKVDINQKQVMFYGIHAQRPGIQNHDERRDQFLQLARQLKEQKLPTVVAGDFNATPFSPIFSQLLEISQIRDSREGFGWQPSWPASFPLLWLPIDHILVSPSIKVHNRITGSYIGSDHYPVIAELSI